MQEIVTNILLVDDRPQNLIALAAILEPLGQNLVNATSGEEALKCLLTSDFAVILLDVQMPGMDGFETAALVKEREKSRHIPIIFLTAISKDEQYVFKGYTVGAVDYLSKPFEPNILRSKVSVFVDLFRKNEQIKQQAELLRQGEQRERERQVKELKQASEQRYRDLAESMPQIVWTARPDGMLTYYNQRWFDYTGLDREQTLAHGWQAVVHPDDYETHQQQWEESVRSGKPYEAEYRLKRAGDNSYRWHLGRALPVRDKTQSIASWIGTSTDIDDRKTAEDGLRFLAEASTVLADSLDYEVTLPRVARLAVPFLCDWCLIDVVNEHGGSIRSIAIAHTDPAIEPYARELLDQYPLESDARHGIARVMREGRSEVYPPLDDATWVISELGEGHPTALRELKTVSYMVVALSVRGRLLGAIRLLSCASGRRYDASDLALAEDLARRIAAALDNAQLYSSVQRERQKLEEVNRAKDEFLATVSHELRTPLNCMLGWTRLLRSGKLDPPTQVRALETIERNTKSQAQLIEDLLDVSRIVAGKLRLSIRAVRFAGVIEAAVDSVRPAVEAKDITLETAFESSDVEVMGDGDRLQQIVWNLLSNAIKFTSAGGHVEVRLEREGSHARVTVADTGQGISADFLPYVFDRFRQADSSSTRAHGGLGLGLAIVRHLVELHGGSVAVTSEGESKGATFMVDIPIAATRGAAEVRLSTYGHEVTGFSCPPELNGLYVVVVEDEPDGRDLFKAVLEECGARVIAVSTAAEALAAISIRVPDILLSDIGIPGEDGYALIRKVRALSPERGGRMPAVALTAYASEDDRLRALSAGFQVHLAKPVEPSHLASVVAGLVARERQAQS